MKWRDAIARVLEEAREPLGYLEIKDLILKQGFKKPTGSTPENTVNRELHAMRSSEFKVSGEVIEETLYGWARASVAKAYTARVEERRGDADRITFIHAYGLIAVFAWLYGIPATGKSVLIVRCRSRPDTRMKTAIIGSGAQFPGGGWMAVCWGTNSILLGDP